MSRKNGERKTLSDDHHTSTTSVDIPGNITQENAVTHALFPRLTDEHKIEKIRLIYVMRNTERIDRIFGADWLDTEYTNGKFQPTDQNIPSSLKKIMRHTTFEFDPPITTLGKYTAQLVGRAMAFRSAAPHQIVCAPALRCVQTACALATTLGAKVGVEYGLAEPGSWFKDSDGASLAPDFLSPDRLEKLGFPIDVKYVPIITAARLSSLNKKETEEASKNRIDFTIKYLGTRDRDGPLLIVGHALTMSIVCDMTVPPVEHEDWKDNLSTSHAVSPVNRLSEHVPEKVDTLELGLRFPYGSVIALARSEGAMPYRYRLCRNIIPPLTLGRYFSSKPCTEKKIMPLNFEI